jgi:hypothetical protein
MENKGIFKAISKVMAEIGAIGKDRKNQQQGFMYRGVEDVMNALQPIMQAHGVFIVPEVVNHVREERTTKSSSTLIYSILTVKHHFYCEDGSEVVAVTIGEGMDSADKSSNKAMSVAFKYACFEVFCIPTEEMNDPDVETPPPSVPRKQAQQTPQNSSKNGAKSNDKQNRDKLLTKTEMVEIWGVKNVEETVLWFEKKLNLPFAEWGEEEADMARTVLKQRKEKRESEERKVRENLSRAGEDLPFGEVYDKGQD